jgi:N-acetylglutamate synthase-like GNAT family acetyltransferase
MTITIRLARSSDIPTLEALIPQSVRGLSGNYYSPEQIEAGLVHVFGLDTQLIEDGTYYVAEIDGQAAGCGGWSRRKGLYGGNHNKGAGADEWLDPARKPARIRAFFVHPQWARRGVGAALMQAAEQAAREAGFQELALLATLPGQPLYAAAGFVADETVELTLPGEVKLRGVQMHKRLEAVGVDAG